MKKLSYKTASEAYTALLILLFPSLPSICRSFGVLCGICAVTALFMMWKIHEDNSLSAPLISVTLFAGLLLSCAALFWAYDRAAHLEAVLTVALAFMLSLLVRRFAQNGGGDRLLRLTYISGLFCALLNLIHFAVFRDVLESGYRFDYGFGNNDLLALFMFVAIIASRTALGNKKTRTRTIAGDLLLAVVFIGARSEIAFIAASLFVFFVILRYRSRLSYLAPIAAIAVLGCDGGIIYALWHSETLQSAAANIFDMLCRAVISIVGMGGGGFKAVSAVYGEAFVPQGALFACIGAMGIFALLLIPAAAAAIVLAARRSRIPFWCFCVTALWSVFVPLFASPLLFALLCGALAALCKEAIDFKVPRGSAYALFALIFAASVFSLAARPFDSASQIAAAKEKLQVFSETKDMQAYSDACKHIDAAMSITPKNLLPLRLRAKAQTEWGAADNAFKTWSEIIEKSNDDMRLYAEYADAIVDYMSRLPRGDAMILTLNEKLREAAQKAEAADAPAAIMRRINDDSDRAQQYLRSQWEFGTEGIIGGSEGE